MVSTLWNIPGIRSKQSQKFLERSLSPICVYDQQGQPIYASQSFLDLLQTEAGEVSFFDYFLSQVYREGNYLADFLANMGTKDQFIIFPSCLISKLINL